MTQAAAKQRGEGAGGRWRSLPRLLGWTRASYVLLSTFLLTIFLLAYFWWPLAVDYLSYADWSKPWWTQVDWLLIGIFLFMTLVLMAGADLRADAGIVLVGLVGGLVIESWGTQTEIWTYYTNERPPLWIIPAWPIASLTIDRLVRSGQRRLPPLPERALRIIYWPLFVSFYGLMLWFVWPTIDLSFTRAALALCALFILTPTDYRLAVITFLAGAGLGYFLELWGTTRLCWTYYTGQQPPLFAVLAHGMAAVAFWRALYLLRLVAGDAGRRLGLRPLTKGESLPGQG